ncbi:hypothetical protein T11_4535 [Trichinella zimbabwensis]|uniref:MULE transposase domain-containing protein n=1 Tax=Trichinella zimbabwensis TaxID=268475 RepID=A0A0V1I7H6_9BILA|nr:hypothetical protein T11_4535 [Trichinella zimbabwensis]
MADIFELRLVPNRCGGMSLVYEGRTYKVKYAGSKRFVLEWDKQGCKSAISTNLDVTTVLKQIPYMETCSRLMMKKPQPRPLSHQHQASIQYSNRSEMQCITNGRNASPDFPEIVRTLKFLIDLSGRILGNRFCCEKVHPSTCWRLRRIVPEWYQQLFTSHAFAAAAVLEVDLNPQTIICDFETALIPAIWGYFLNTRVQSCYFYFCQAVHSKVGELSLKTRYRTEEETKIKMLLATAFILVLQVDMGVSLLEERMTDNKLPLWNVYNADFRTNNHLEGWHNQLNKMPVETSSGNAAAGDLRQVSRVYAETQRQVIRYTGECPSGRRTLEQFLKSLMYLAPELI